MKKTENTILFYTSKNFIFRSGIIGYLYEICQVYSVILLSEELDEETDGLIRDKKLFPKLEKIIPVRQYSGKKMNLFSRNRYLCGLAENVIFKRRPDILMTISDTHSIFDLYLMRFAKRIKAIKIAVQSSNMENNTIVKKYIDLENANIRFPLFLPLWFRIFLMNLRKYAGHFLYYWLLPLTVGERPFFGKVGHILWMGCSGRKGADYQTVFSKRDYDIHVQDGVPAKKIYIVTHPVLGKAKEFFEKIFLKSAKRGNDDKKIITFIWPAEEIGFRRLNYSLISKEENQNIRKEIISLTAKILQDWKIFLKPHPDIVDLKEIKDIFKSISDLVEITDQLDPIDKYLEISDVIVGIPPCSTAIFTAFLQYPKKPLLTIDLSREVFGDSYKDFGGIEYIDNKEKFTEILELIRDNKYRKRCEVKLEPEGFMSITNFLKFLLKEHGK
ncbi:MAG: hypothetical protein Q7S82_01015 [bacterium]|nr:hypothetical protein [bacterium]